MTAQEALRRQRQLEAHAREFPIPTANTEVTYPMETTRTVEMPTMNIVAEENPSLSIIESSLPVARTQPVVMPSATTRTMDTPPMETTISRDLPVMEATTGGSMGGSTGAQMGDTLEMIKASKMYSDPNIRRQVDQIESQSQKVDSYSPVGDYLKKKRGGQ